MRENSDRLTRNIIPGCYYPALSNRVCKGGPADNVQYALEGHLVRIKNIRKLCCLGRSEVALYFQHVLIHTNQVNLILRSSPNFWRQGSVSDIVNKSPGCA